MPTIGDYLFGDYAGERRREIQEEQQANLAQTIGEPGRPGIADLGIGPLRAQDPSGIFQQPGQDQAVALGKAVSAAPGFADKGLSLLGSALEQRAELVEAEGQFIRDQARQNQEFSTTNSLALDKWATEKALKTSQRQEQAAKSVQDLLLGEQQLDFRGKSEARSIRDAERAELVMQRLPPAEAERIVEGSNKLAQMQSNIQTYKKGFAWNTKTEVGAVTERELLKRKTDKDENDLAKLEFWRDVDSYSTYLLKELSGGAVTPEEYDRLARLLPTGLMSDIEVDRNMRTLHREINNTLQLRAKAAVFGDFKDPTPLFRDAQSLPPQGSFAEEAPADVFTTDMLPEGAFVVPPEDLGRLTRRGRR